VLDVSIAARHGTVRETGAFFVAARIPLGLVAIVMVGANQALVPTVSTWLQKKTRIEGSRLVSALLGATLALDLAIRSLTRVFDRTGRFPRLTEFKRQRGGRCAHAYVR
jgi:peptidoglycan biosynthesis protein MviN/MurJ (putative lipid II flippase)